MTSTSPSSPSPSASSSATATSISRETYSSSLNWQPLSIASPEIPDEFYKGAIAEQIAAAVQKGGGLITEKDLAEYNVVERDPIHGTYRGLDVYSAPPPSSGGVALMEILNILEASTCQSSATARRSPCTSRWKP